MYKFVIKTDGSYAKRNYLSVDIWKSKTANHFQM